MYKQTAKKEYGDEGFRLIIETAGENGRREEIGCRQMNLSGYLNDRTAAGFLEEAAGQESSELLINCRELKLITTAGTEALRALKNCGTEVRMDDLNQDCFAALFVAGLQDLALGHTNIPEVDISKCQVLGEGANGIVYQIDEDRILKLTKTETSFDEIIMERDLTKKAFFLGVSCPISFGFALVGGRIAMINEMASATSFLKLIKKDFSNTDRYMETYVELIRRLHEITGDALAGFPRQVVPKQLLEKADHLDDLLPKNYQGGLRKLLEAIDEPEVLTHGDIQPRNVRIDGDKAMLIDMETLSTGPSVIDLGALHRTLFADWEYGGNDGNSFLGLTAEESREFWDKFVKAYFAGQDEESVKKNLLNAEAIAHILAVAKMRKRKTTGKELENGILKLVDVIDRFRAMNSSAR